MTDRTLHVTESEAERIAALEPGEPVQIRRPVEPQPWEERGPDGEPGPLRWEPVYPQWWGTPEELATNCPYGQPGDRLMVVLPPPQCAPISHMLCYLTIEGVRVECRDADGDYYWVIDARRE